MMASSTLPNLQQRLVKQMRREPKKAIVLAVLTLAVAVLWARIFLFKGAGPATASAFSGAAPAVPALAGASKAQMSAASRSLHEWIKVPITPLRRNLFQVNLDYFPRDGSVIAPMMEGQGFWEEVAKSLSRRADQEKAKRILVENLRSQAAKLKLQSTVMTNGSPKALVNDTMVNQGDTIEGFKVVVIESRRIIVEREGVRLEVLFNYR
jgi:hypothetical protein